MRRTQYITRLVFLITITLAVEWIGLPQPATGPFVNFMLILTTYLLNVYAGMLLGFITPVLALVRGQLPVILSLYVPFIMAGNAIFVFIFHIISRNKSGSGSEWSWRKWLGLFLAATVKFMWFYITAHLFLPLLLTHAVPEKILAILTFPQLITAIIGGTLALLFHALLVQRKIVDTRVGPFLIFMVQVGFFV